MGETVKFDCGQGEAGGQVLRTALSVAAITGKSFKLKNIRANRPTPGLKPQHLTAVKTLAKICQAEVEGAELKAEEITFTPGKIVGGQFSVNIGTAGSITLLLQTILLPAMFAKEKLSLRIFGGTDVAWSPPINYFREVFFPTVNSMGAGFKVETVKHGYYPKGNGVVQFESKPGLLPLKYLERTQLESLQFIALFSHCASLPKEVALNQAKAAKKFLNQSLGEMDIEEKVEWFEQSNTIGSGCDLYAVYQGSVALGANALGKKGKAAAEVGREAVDALLKEVKANKPVDSHLGNQLIPFMAIAKGTSTIEVSQLTNHTQTNINVCEQLLGVKFEVEGKFREPARISVKGLGLGRD